MSSVIRDLIEYKGIDICFKNSLKNFRQVNFENIFSIPCQKPNIEQIVKVSAETKIYQYTVIETPKGTSLEGQNLTGYKLLICGDIKYTIQYVADVESQSVHTFHQIIPFGGYVVLPEKFNKNSYITASALIEDIVVEQVDERSIYSNINILLIADISC